MIVRGSDKSSRITSYNVCYTKLLRGASQDGILVDNSILAEPPVASKLKTQEFIDDHISAMEADYPDNIVQQVRHTINGLLPISDCRLENVAKVFNLHPRVLQQKLASSGSYNFV